MAYDRWRGTARSSEEDCALIIIRNKPKRIFSIKEKAYVVRRINKLEKRT